MTMKVSEEDLARVLALRHHVGNQRHTCRCDECRAIIQVVAAARENNARKAAWEALAEKYER